MPVMDVGIVRVAVRHGRVDMPVRVGLYGLRARFMLMAVMLVVNVVLFVSTSCSSCLD
jgi:hypothetical protein